MLSFSLYADNSKTAFVQFVNRKAQVHIDGKSIILKRGERLSMNEEVTIKESGNRIYRNYIYRKERLHCRVSSEGSRT